MAIPLPATTVTPGKTISVPLQSVSNIQAVKFSNGSPYDVTVSGFGALPPGTIIPEGTEVFPYADVENQGRINILPVDNYNVGGTSVVNMVIYLAGEKLPTDRGYWPVTIPVQTVRATVSSVSTLSNEGAPVGTLVIDIGPTPSALNNMLDIWNDHFIWSVVQGGVAHQVLKGQTSGNPLQLGQTNDNTEVLGALYVDQGEFVTGTLTATGGLNTNTIRDNVAGNTAIDLSAGTGAANFPIGIILPNNIPLQSKDTGGTVRTLIVENGSNQTVLASGAEVVSNPPTSHATWFQVQGTLYGLVDTRGFVAPSGASQGYTFENGNFLPDISFFTGVGSGTYNHGYGSAPFDVIPIVTATNSSATQGYDTVTSTQVHITLGASLAFKAFCV